MFPATVPPSVPAAAEVEVLVIRPVRLPSRAADTVFAPLRLEGSDLDGRARPDAVLRSVPTANLFRRNGSEAANPTTQGLSLRGIAPSGAGRSLVLLEGAPLNDPFGGWVIWSAIPVERLDGIELVRGAGAGAWGAGALTGVISLEEADPRAGLLRLDLSAGDHGQFRAAAAAGDAGLLTAVSASRGPAFTPVRGGSRGAADRPLDLEAYSLSARLRRDLGAVTLATGLSGWRESRDSGLAGAASQSSGVAADGTLADIRAGTGWRVQGWVRASDLRNSSSSVSAGRATTTPASDQYATPAHGFGLNAAWRIASGDWSWELGTDARLAEGRALERFRYQGGGFTRGRESGGRTSVAGVYLEASHDAPGQVIALGARLDAWSQTDAVRRERDLATGALVLSSAAPDASGVTGSFRAGIRQDLTPSVWVRSAAYSGFRPPTLNELHRPFRVGNDVTEANPSLRPETLVGLEAGAGGAAGAWTWSASLFANRLSDPITNVTVGVGPGTFPVAGFIPAGGVLRQRRNAGRIDAYGLEAETRGKAGPVDLRAALAWTDSQVDGGTSAPQLTDLRPAQTARLTATASAAWTVGPQAGFELSVRHEGERFDDDLNTRRLKAALTLDGRFTWALSDATRLYLAVDNLANAAVQAAVSGDGAVGLAAPRLVRIGVSLRR